MTETEDTRYTLENRINQLESQKTKLLRELDELEERYEKTDKLYRRYLPLLVDALSQSDTEFSTICKDLSTALKKGASIGKIEYIFDQLKDVILKQEMAAGGAEGQRSGMLSSFFKKGGSDLVEEFKNGYQDIVNKLKSTLDDAYTPQLKNITAKINNCTTTNDIKELREDIFGLVYTYISDANKDREKITAFVLEIVERIFEIEANITNTYENAEKIIESSEGFESVMDSELDEIKRSANVAENLEDLKKKIAQRLAAINKALMTKKAKDKALKEVVGKNQATFLQNFARLKRELKDATEHSKDLEKKLNQDQLTGAYNRSAYDKRIEDEMARYLRYGTIFSLLLIDADHFKKVNDSYGHAIGDRCLQEIIKRTLPLLRQNDMLARYGGEEFVVIMPHTDVEGAGEAAEKIRQTIEKIEFVYKKKKVKITVSIGVSQVNENDKTHKTLFERADIAVYQAKSKGRNRVVLN